MTKTKVLIIGGGPSGLFLSCLLPSSILLEKTDKCGKKLLLTGGGACNYTHKGSAEELLSNYFEKKSFVTPALSNYPPDEIIKQFKAWSVMPRLREDGCVFPTTDKAQTVLSALLTNAHNVRVNEKIETILKRDDSFYVKTETDEFEAKYLVLATGGMSFPLTGSTGDGYSYAKLFNHSIIQPNAALCAIKLELKLEGLEGVPIKDVTLSFGKKKVTGDILFTRNGITGPAAFTLSRELKTGDEIIISFSKLSEEELIRANGKKQLNNVLKELTGLPLALIDTLIPNSRITMALLTKAQRKQIITLLTNLKVKVNMKGQLNLATVTRGGVDTKEINRSTMESRIVPNLYFAGEVIDVDGECGGYNLTFCFSSSALIKKAIEQKEKS